MTAGAVEQPRRHELTVFVVLAFAISWAMHIPLALATLRSGDPPPPLVLRSTCWPRGDQPWPPSS
jgi:hypothetical protein